MRVSVVTCVSTAIDLLKYSTKYLLSNAGTRDFDLIVVTWLASKDVLAWLNERPWIRHVVYNTNPKVGYVPNLRGMINLAFDSGFDLNDRVVFTNTDVVYGQDWLSELVRWGDNDNWIVNSQHITPIRGGHVITLDLGEPIEGRFDEARFFEVVKAHRRPGDLEKEEERGGWRNTATMPYLIHKKWWDQCGPWELTGVGRGLDPPDRRFFQRCHDAGAEFVMAMGSIVYHHEGVERGRSRPAGAESLPEEGEL